MFLIQGLYSPDDDASLYWSNDEGWVLRADATRFEDEDLEVLAFPMEAIAVEMLDEEGDAIESIAIKDLWERQSCQKKKK
jgi:hypothetical protein